jgi:hypothetical protein
MIRNYLIHNFIICRMMDENKTPKSNSKENDKDKNKVSVAIIISMILLGVVLVAFLGYQYLGASRTDVHVLDVEVLVSEVSGNIYIQSIEYNMRKMPLLDSPRSDDEGVIPGVRVKVSKGQDILSYDTFVKYNVEGTYNLVCGFKKEPEQDDVLECTVWVFSKSDNSFADDQESIQVIWGREKVDYVIEAKVSVNSTQIDIGSDAKIEGVQLTSKQKEQEVNSKNFFPGVFGYALLFNSQISYVAVKDFEGGFNYTLFIGLLEEPDQGDELVIVIKVYQRKGQWVDGYYQEPVDSYTENFVWG